MLRALIASPARSFRALGTARAATASCAIHEPSATPAPFRPMLHKYHPGPAPRQFSTDAAAEKKAFDDFYDNLSPARKKLLDVLNEYKSNNFEHATPSRFFKMIVQAVDGNHDGVITTEEYQTLLKNIGAEGKMTEQDMVEIFDEVGVDKGGGDGEKVISVKGLEERWTPFLHVMWKK